MGCFTVDVYVNLENCNSHVVVLKTLDATNNKCTRGLNQNPRIRVLPVNPEH